MSVIRHSTLYVFVLFLFSIAALSAVVFQTCSVDARELALDVDPPQHLPGLPPPPPPQGPGQPPLPPLPDLSPCELACNQASFQAIGAINEMESALMAQATTEEEVRAVRDLIMVLLGIAYDSWRLCLLACGTPIEVVQLIIGLLFGIWL
ncbi:hypothetical protein SH449x_003150 [Pirellulaceae bacterium SH449]